MFADEERVTIPIIIGLFTQTVVYFSHRDVVVLCESSSKWQLLFSFSKCTLLTIDHLTHLNNYLMEFFHFENVEDLGIKIDSHLKFHQHYSLIISKANTILGIIANLFKFLNEIFLRIHTPMGYPILEYGNLIWDPILNLIKQLLERCSSEPLDSRTHSNAMLTTHHAYH